MRSFIQESIRKFINAITPPPVAGLFVGDTDLQYLELREAPKIISEFNLSAVGAKSALLRLQPGILDGGKIKNKPSFVAALRELHDQITPDSHKILSVALTLPASEVFVQTFNLPNLAERSLAQAAELNAKMISPMPIENAYYAWQRIGEDLTEGGQIELLGAFINKSVVDDLTSSLREGGFGVAVVEFSSFSIVRNLDTLGILNKKLPYLVIELNTHGLDFMILKNGNLYFDYSLSWETVQGPERNISLPILSKVLKEEIQRIFNFYSGRWGSAIKNFVVVTPTLESELTSIIKEFAHEAEVQVLPVSTVNPVLGASLRGLKPRVKDFDISLTGLSVSQTFLQDQIVSLISIWRNILFATFGFMVLIYVGSELFLISSAKDIESRTIVSLRPADDKELAGLKDQVANFNRLVDLTGTAKGSDRHLSPFIKALPDLGGDRIGLIRVTLPAVGNSGLIVGETDSEESAIDFKNKVATLPQLTEVDLPLGDLVNQPNGRIAFTLRFRVKSLDF